MVIGYIGSKYKNLDKLDIVLTKHIPDIGRVQMTFGDLFAGTHIVGRTMADKHSFQIISNDQEYFSYVIGVATLQCNYTEKVRQIIKRINEVEIESIIVDETFLIFHNYSPAGDRKYFTRNNAKLIDYSRQKINALYEQGDIDIYEFYFCLASLIVSIDKIANTIGVYCAWLSEFKTSALKQLVLTPIHTRTNNDPQEHQVFQEDVRNMTKYEYDIVYLDPPFNRRQYGSNYSLLNYLCYYNSELKICGKGGVLTSYNHSNFSLKHKAREALQRVALSVKTRYLMLSYSDDGIVTRDEIVSILSELGDVHIYTFTSDKFNSSKGRGKKIVKEYIYFVEIVA